jgi:hypothetical protein
MIGRKKKLFTGRRQSCCAVLKVHLWKIKHGDSNHERKGVVLNFQTLGLNAKAM